MKLLGIITALITTLGIGQTGVQTYQVNPRDSKLEVQGTSTLHDWEIEAEEMSGKASINMESRQLTVDALNFAVKSRSLKSGKSSMDNNTFKALKTEKYPTINFVLTSIESTSGSYPTYKLNAKGNLTIAGVTREVSMPVTAAVHGEQIAFKGRYEFNMTDYKIDPPTALMGTIKTGDELTIDFEILYTK